MWLQWSTLKLWSEEDTYCVQKTQNIIQQSLDRFYITDSSVLDWVSEGCSSQLLDSSEYNKPDKKKPHETFWKRLGLIYSRGASASAFNKTCRDNSVSSFWIWSGVESGKSTMNVLEAWFIHGSFKRVMMTLPLVLLAQTAEIMRDAWIKLLYTYRQAANASERERERKRETQTCHIKLSFSRWISNACFTCETISVTDHNVIVCNYAIHKQFISRDL